jgi:hypothetical protein
VSCGAPAITPEITPLPHHTVESSRNDRVLATIHDTPPKPKRSLAIFLISVLAVGLVFGGTQAYQQWNEARLERLAQETLVEAFGQDVLTSAVTSCQTIARVVESVPEQQIAAYAGSLEEITDPRQALLVSQDRDFPSESYAPAYRVIVEAETVAGLALLFRESERDDIAPADQMLRWESEWVDYALSACNVLGQYETNLEILVAADRSVDRIATMAANAPWYPEGFSEYSTNLAYRWSTNEGGWPCSGCSFWKITVVTKNGCPSGLYGEINILQGGSVVDWTNDLIAYLGPGDSAILTFIRYPYRSTLTGQLVDLTCY